MDAMQTDLEEFEQDIAVALATCPKRYLVQAASKGPSDADMGRAKVAAHIRQHLNRFQITLKQERPRGFSTKDVS